MRSALALATLVLFGHAVILHLLHVHVPDARVSSQSSASSISGPQHVPAGETHGHDGCPACQLQHGFTFLGATPAVLCLAKTAADTPEFAPLCATHLIWECVPPGRAPPIL